MPVNSVSESLAEEGEQAEEEEEEGPGYTWKVGRKMISLAKFAKYYATREAFKTNKSQVFSIFFIASCRATAVCVCKFSNFSCPNNAFCR